MYLWGLTTAIEASSPVWMLFNKAQIFSFRFNVTVCSNFLLAHDVVSCPAKPKWPGQNKYSVTERRLPYLLCDCSSYLGHASEGHAPPISFWPII